MKATQAPSAVSCKLNEKWEEASKSKRFIRGRIKHINPWSSHGYETEGLKDKQHPRRKGFEFSYGEMGCCGLEELDLQPLQKGWDSYKDDPDFRDLVCRYIREAVQEKDNRVLIVGIPTKVGNNSQYNIDYYNKVREVLEDVGFKQLGNEYKNVNSGNTIVALTGQLP